MNEQAMPEPSRQKRHYLAEPSEFTFKDRTELDIIGNGLDIRAHPKNGLEGNVILVTVQKLEQVHENPFGTATQEAKVKKKNLLTI